MKITSQKTNTKGIYKFVNPYTIDLIDSKTEVLRKGTKVIILDKTVFDHMLDTIIDNFYDVSDEWLSSNYPNIKYYVLNIYTV